MKVLLVSDLYHPNAVGGSEIWVRDLAEALVAQGHGVAVATLNPEKRYEVAEVNGVRVHYLPLKNLYFLLTGGNRPPGIARALWHAIDSYNPFMSASFGRVLDAEHPDLVNTHNFCGFSASVWRAAKRRRIPLVHTVRGYYLLCSRGDMFRNNSLCSTPCTLCRVYSWPRRRLSRYVDVATAVSRFMMDIHRAFGVFPAAQKVQIYNHSQTSPESRRRAGEEDQTLRFGYLGRLQPTKGIDLLVRSFMQLPAGQAELLIAGQGEPNYERELKRLTLDCPRVKWLGFMPPEDIFPKVNVVVVPSLWHDPAPQTVLESMAHGVPVIGARRGGIPELMGEGTGWTFEPDEPGALARALQHAIESKSELAVMGKRASERARQFSSEAMVSRYLEAYGHAIDKAGPRGHAVPSRRRDGV